MRKSEAQVRVISEEITALEVERRIASSLMGLACLRLPECEVKMMRDERERE